MMSEGDRYLPISRVYENPVECLNEALRQRYNMGTRLLGMEDCSNHTLENFFKFELSDSLVMMQISDDGSARRIASYPMLMDSIEKWRGTCKK